MKIRLLLSFTIISFFYSAHSYAQKVSVESKDAKQMAGVHAKFSCTLSDFDSTSSAVDIANQIRLCNGVLKIAIESLENGNVKLVLITNEENHIEIIQNAFIKVGIEWVYVDSVRVKSEEMFNYIKN